MNSEITTSVLVIFVLLECLYDHGFSKEEIEERVGIEQSKMDGSAIQIPYKQLLDLWQLAVNVTGNPALAIHLREKYGKDLTHFTSLLGMNSKSVLEGLENMKRFSPLFSDIEKIEFYQDNEFVTILYNNIDPLYQNIWMPEYIFYLFVYYGRLEIDETLNPVEVHFQHACPAAVSTYENFFKSPVLFTQGENALKYKKEVLQLKFKCSNPHLQSILEKKAELDLKHIAEGTTVEKEVRQYIVKQLSTGRVSVEMTASALNMSRSTLHRKLREESITFDLLLKDVRKNLAKTYITHGMNMTQIAYSLGYSNASNFNKAFKLWYGESPGVYRKRMMTPKEV